MMNKKIDTLRPELYPIPVKSPCRVPHWDGFCWSYLTSVKIRKQISDYFTKFAWAKALWTKEARPVVDYLHEVSLLTLSNQNL